MARLWYESGPKTTFDGLARYLQAATEAGTLRVENPKRAALFFLGMVIFEGHVAMSIGADPPAKAEMEEVVNGAVEVFLAAYGRQPRRPAPDR